MSETHNNPLKIALLQHACVEDPAINLQLAEEMIRKAAADGAKLIITQELFTSQYFPQVADPNFFTLAQAIPGPGSQRLSGLAKELNVAISASLFEKRMQGVYHNTSIMLDESGQIVGKYRKMHIPDDPGFYEKFYFTPGDASPPNFGFGVQYVAGMTTGMLICWDQWFPEPARITSILGAQMLLYPTAIGGLTSESTEEHERQRRTWQTMQVSHAIANGVFVASVNRVGQEGDIHFWGHSFVCGPDGNIIAQAGGEQEILYAWIDPSLIEKTRQVWPFLRDRRVDAYSPLTSRLVD